MSPPDSILEAQTMALLRRLAREKEMRVRKLHDEAEEQAQDILRRARGEARQRIRQAVKEARRETENGIAVRRAALETQARRSRQDVVRALLERAWQRLPGALELRWQDAAARAEWCRAACAQAARSLRETRDLRVELAAAADAELGDFAARELRALGAGSVKVVLVPALGPGIRIRGGDACIDASLPGLLAARDRVAAELLAEFDGNAKNRTARCDANEAMQTQLETAS